MKLSFGRPICGKLTNAASREWLVTNGIGGYASGTIAGLLTRRYHGLLIAALQPPLARKLLVTKFDETAFYQDISYPLYTNRWADGTLEPQGFRYIERFNLEGTTPVWTFTCADSQLEKRVWMGTGENTTYVRYQLSRGSAPFTLTAKVLVNYRYFHGSTQGSWDWQIDPVPGGLRFQAFEGGIPFYLLSQQADITPKDEWFRDFALSAEQYRGFKGIEDHLNAGEFRATLLPGESVTIIATTNPDTGLDGSKAYTERRQHEGDLIASFERASQHTSDNSHPVDEITERLLLAADQFIVQRAAINESSDNIPIGSGASSVSSTAGHSIIAGYPWFGDWGRDTMISLPGLALSTGRHDIARSILLTFSRFVDEGMLPNRFTSTGETPEYNTADATLWFFEAVRAYHAATGDDEFLKALFPVLMGILTWHQRGTRYQIHVDRDDGLLYAGQPGVQLTWMDAKVDDWVVTPRTGKPVEINALWYNALRSMSDFARQLGEPSKPFDELGDRTQSGFARFWNPVGNCCFDVIDGPNGNDDSLRPNQILAVSLTHSPLDMVQQKAVIDAAARHLLTSHGLRSLAPQDPLYAGHYGGDTQQRDSAYHQGTVWGWLIGPFVSAHLRVYKDRQLARSFLQPLISNMADHGLGTISEIFDGDPPFTPRGCIAQAWSVAEVLRAWLETEQY